jgi:hypothetical protein
MAVGQLVGPPILAQLVQSHGSWSIVPVYITATAAAGLVLALLFRREELRLAASRHAMVLPGIAGGLGSSSLANKTDVPRFGLLTTAKV